MVCQKACRPSTSTAAVGSSSTSRSGLLTRATANRTRCVCPPDSRWVRCRAKPVAPVSSSTSSTGNGFGYSAAIMPTSSRTDRSRISEPTCSMAPIRPRLTASRGAVPNTDTVPASGGSRPSSMSMVVDLPAPLGPSSVTVSPDAIEMFTPAHRGYHALPGAE